MVSPFVSKLTLIILFFAAFVNKTFQTLKNRPNLMFKRFSSQMIIYVR